MTIESIIVVCVLLYLFKICWDFVSTYDAVMKEIRSMKGTDDVIFK